VAKCVDRRSQPWKFDGNFDVACWALPFSHALAFRRAAL
jgi:hypothetical protein